MIILCADDYGLSPAVSRGIIELSETGRLSATSALVTLGHWPTEAQHLRSIRATTALGLHLNLTLGRPLIAQAAASHLDRAGVFLPINKLIIAALTRRIDQNQIQQECSAQIAAFHQATGFLPDFIDGHQHVHALPVVRHGLIAAINEFSWPQPPLIRNPTNAPRNSAAKRIPSTKQIVVTWLSSGFTTALGNSDLPFNQSFAGFSNFASNSDVQSELETALVSSAQCHLVMCHPGYVDETLRQSGDPIIERRAQELKALQQIDRLPERICHPGRNGDDAIDWRQAMRA